MSKVFAVLAGFTLTDVKSILSDHESEEKGKEEVNNW